MAPEALPADRQNLAPRRAGLAGSYPPSEFDPYPLSSCSKVWNDAASCSGGPEPPTAFPSMHANSRRSHEEQKATPEMKAMEQCRTLPLLWPLNAAVYSFCLSLAPASKASPAGIERDSPRE